MKSDVNNYKNVCLVHDSFLHIGGAENVLLKLVEKYPAADIFIPLISDGYLELLQSKTNGKIYRLFLSKWFKNEKFASFLKPLLIIYWERLNLGKYGLIISSSHSFSSKSVNKNKGARHISYIHTPPRYLYKEFNQMGWIKKFPFNFILWPLFFLLRKYDYYSAQKADILITNSKNVQDRIKKYYHRDSSVIYPDLKPKSKTIKRKPRYFLFFSRLETQKGAELVVKTCTRFNIPLVVVGTGSKEKYLKKIAGKSIIFTGFISEKQKEKIFSYTQALIYTSIDEDYGMVLPEINSYGIPIIAYNSGAIKEFAFSKNIYLFDEYSEQGLKNAIDKSFNYLKKEVQS